MGVFQTYRQLALRALQASDLMVFCGALSLVLRLEAPAAGTNPLNPSWALFGWLAASLVTWHLALAGAKVYRSHRLSGGFPALEILSGTSMGAIGDTLVAGVPDMPVHQMFRMPRMQTLLGELGQRYDFVIVDTPPVGPVSDCALLARWIDGLVLIVTAHKTPRKQLENAFNMLEGAPILGIVFNCDDKARAGYRRDYRGYFPRTRRRPPQPPASRIAQP